MNKLTERQERAFHFIRNRSRDTGSSPTLRELCDYMGYSAVGSAQDVVAALRRKGFLKPVGKRAARSFILTDKGKTYGLSADELVEVGVNGYSIPCLGSVPAGNPLEGLEERVGTLRLSASIFSSPKPRSDRLFALKANGLSMVNAGIMDGDWLIVSSQQGATTGNIVVARVNGEATVKRLEKDIEGWFLKPENEAFPVIRGSERPFDIVGKVVALQRTISC